MRIARHFTTPDQDALQGVPFEARESRIVNPDGSVVFEAADVMIPKGWSQVAVDIMAQKYFRKAGVASVLTRVPEEGVPAWLWRSEAGPGAANVGERDSRQVFERLAGTWAYWGWKHNYFDSEEDVRAFHDELVYMLATQRSAPNSPQWFNTGLHWAYGITGPAQGHWYVDPVTSEVHRSTSAYERPQPHACFIQSVADDLVNEGGIMDLWTREARIFKYGSGTGSNFSKIRGSAESLSGGGRSSGLMSFLKIGDRAAGAIKSGGTTRRAAKMVIVDVDHPDIEEFIDWKVVEEQKVAALVAGSKVIRRHLRDLFTAASEDMNPLTNRGLRRAASRARRDGVPEGYIERVLQLAAQGASVLNFADFSTDWEGEAYLTVSGQNANNSVRVTQDFLDAVRDDRDWALTRRTDGAVHKMVPARELWDRVARAAWHSADPGVQFDTTINEWHTSPAGGRINGSNPCSEYMFLDDTACNLASLNLLRFTDLETGAFDIEGYEYAVRLWTIVLEISVLMAQFPSRDIAQLSYDYRTLGLGYANLGATLMVLGIPYDSREALGWSAAITAIMTGASYATSAELASELGAFPRYAENRESMLRVMRNHRRAAYGSAPREYEGLTALPVSLDASACPPELVEAARRSWDVAVRLGETFGYRNAQSTLIAPTGTIGLLMDCDTTGVEPDFALVKFKKLAGGGYFRIINESVPVALRRLGYSKRETEEIVAYCAGTGSLDGAPSVNRITLSQRGFTQPVLDRIEGLLRTAFHIAFVFNRWTLGDEFLTSLGFTVEQLADPGFDLLGSLGFTREQVEEANDHILGRMTIEGAPHLLPEHYAVFDCATKCGKYGTRFIEPMAHVRMLAATQPFLSGAISKTINMPAEASIDDVREVYDEAGRLGVKALALYRDGSKLSQPLSGALAEALDEEEFEEDREEALTLAVEQVAASAGVEHPAVIEAERIIRSMPRAQLERWIALMSEEAMGLGRGHEERLPARRRGYAQKAKVGGHTIYLHTGEFEATDAAGRPRLGEIFVSMSKDGAAFRSLMNCFAIAVSIGLQRGVPLEDYVDSFTFTKFEPNGMVTGHDRISMATSIIDYVFRDLAVNYLGRDDLAHFGPVDLSTDSTAEEEEDDSIFAPDALPQPSMVVAPIAPLAAGDSSGVATAVATPVAEHAPASVAASSPAPARQASYVATTDITSVSARRTFAKQAGFEGDPCSECGQMMMVRNGTCLKCMNCGATSGCS